ncbi:helix-turn-helix domain-containing protein [Saccharopolyspora rosea]|uniref:helix-turn-helix domain-containing protein n=1 Tax=Saccharopolyspora rosea TaxID=524884 RepID=UPI0021D9F956|nr:helix-turn-helix transcriptional regulator [Saccharopolyspora rosea]
MARTSPTFRRRRLARRIRQLREASGLTQEAAAAGLDMSTSALSRKETGEVATSVHEVRSMMDLYDVYDPDLLDLARAAKQRGWWRAYGIEDRKYPDLETEASEVREFALAFIPGLFQTADYMRAVFRCGNPGCTDEFIENAVALRKARAERINGTDVPPLDYSAVIDESALRRPVGGAETMRRQLVQLVERAELPSVTVRVLPIGVGAHRGMESSFCLLRYPGDEPDVLYMEHVAGSSVTEKRHDVRRAEAVFDEIWTSALDTSASVDLIHRVAREM